MTPRIGLPRVIQSNAIWGNDLNITSCSVLIQFSGGNLLLFLGLSDSPTTAPTEWEQTTAVTTNTLVSHSFTMTGKWLYYRIVMDPSTIIQTPQNSVGVSTAPAIKITNIIEG